MATGDRQRSRRIAPQRPPGARVSEPNTTGENTQGRQFVHVSEVAAAEGAHADYRGRVAEWDAKGPLHRALTHPPKQ